MAALWAAAVPVEVHLPGVPPCTLQIDPSAGTFHLRTAYQSPEPDVGTLRNVDFHAIADGNDDVAEIVVRVNDGGVQIGYRFLAAIISQLQQEARPLGEAVATAVAQFRNLTMERSPLPIEREIGLLGELLFLEYCITALGPQAAVSAWHGPLAEEHDFTIGSVHVEVKSTATDRRIHVIHGLDQLEPLTGVPLVLLSMQLTRSSPDSGRTLPAVIAAVRAHAGAQRGALDVKLAMLGWDDFDADLHDTPWAVRSAPLAYAVDGDFPAITSDRLGGVVPHLGQISDVSYRVDLTDREPTVLAHPLRDFTEWSQ
ncbi:PD-(D/E)XK motif protein [Microbacterium arborescens]|uniref:PD-(D/E)XK motif protein n=1 Tax=Microbacterium arborescens TaxID=33883 RepID=UPI00196518B2|nr:PD-(D/E)XK motif protein [Microbacterium arborescens]